MLGHKILFYYISALIIFSLTACNSKTSKEISINIGSRPYSLIHQLKEGQLKKELQACANKAFFKSDFSIGHRGAPMRFPEHTKESYEAAVSMGAGIVECDVTFTKDRELVCRHSQCDLHTTTNILGIPELASKCSTPFSPAQINPRTGKLDKMATAKCCTSDISLTEFKRLQGKVDEYNPRAVTPDEYMEVKRSEASNMRLERGTLMSHAESIQLFKRLGVKMIPELKPAMVKMPFEGDYTLDQFAQQMIDDYKNAGVDASQVFAQSFDINNILYWINNEEKFGVQAVYLDDKIYKDAENQALMIHNLVAQGINYIAPPMWVLLTLDSNKAIVPSTYAEDAKNAGINIITWTLERSKFTKDGAGWYYQSINDSIDNEGDMLTVLDVLAQDVGIKGIFSDWPETVTYYANCKNL